MSSSMSPIIVSVSLSEYLWWRLCRPLSDIAPPDCGTWTRPPGTGPHSKIVQTKLEILTTKYCMRAGLLGLIIQRISPSDLTWIYACVYLTEIVVGFNAPFLFATKTWVCLAQSQQFGLEEVEINQHPGYPRTFQQQLLCK